jgi:hypothetical protein
MLPMPSLMPNVETNFAIQGKSGKSGNYTFYIQATTLDSSTVANFTFNGIQDQILKVPTGTMSYIKVHITGVVMSGTNINKCGYYEQDTILVTRSGTTKFIGAAGGTLLKTNKDAAFTSPTIDLTKYNSRFAWSPTIVGGASETVYWTAKVEVMRQGLGEPLLPPSVDALYQNLEGILFENSYNLEWN